MRFLPPQWVLVLVIICSARALPAQTTDQGPPLSARDERIIAAAKPGPEPRINGARIIGIQPRTPFLFDVAVTGQAPISLTVKGLPSGLKLDRATGLITGAISSKGPHDFTLLASNPAGRAEAQFRIVAGDALVLTPPLGWNSYDAFGDSVHESEVLTNAAWLKAHLQPAGWDTVVIDFRWYDSMADGIRVQNPEGVLIDANGRCIPPANRFPSAAGGLGFKPLADQIHAMGLKFGIHIMRGIPRKAVEADTPIAGSPFRASQAVLPPDDPNRACLWNRDMFGVDANTGAGKAWYASLARQYAAWGVDYIKCDDISFLGRGRFYGADEIEALSRALRASGRSIVLSLSPGPAPVDCAPHLKQFANLWRVSGDFWDNWKSLNANFTLLADWLPDSGPGHWADADMIPFGHIALRNCDVHPERWTRFTRDEQLTLLSLWFLAPSPLMLGMNLPDNDPWTTAILSNPEVLAINQDPLGLAGRRLYGPPVPVETWLKSLADGSTAVGFFNRSNQTAQIAVPWKNLGFLAPPQVRDLWLRRPLGRQDRYTDEIPAHGCVLLSVK
ncbi:MAG: putative Ig domain-containing protein [Verrucomicrobiota bacterium]